MYKIFVMVGLMFIASLVNAQDKYFTKTGRINFDATAVKSPEKITAVNKSVICVLDTKTGDMQFSVLTTGFEFQRAAMQEHFNENYVESTKYPKSEFKGAITNNADVKYTKDGTYKVNVKGKLTLHGETKDVETPGVVIVKGGKISVNATFNITLADYKVEVPGMVSDKVSKTAKINVDCALELLKK